MVASIFLEKSGSSPAGSDKSVSVSVCSLAESQFVKKSGSAPDERGSVFK